ncbi:MAG: hypothetical protein CVU84_13475 [Firmicutes bacterium HGW-Firmicutes-1]|jgi:hypothetical protein|nr:MAG: hypothetical protein CVU84_13475 [Firmicutes bacterium HGW-Firmicutes-1]
MKRKFMFFLIFLSILVFAGCNKDKSYNNQISSLQIETAKLKEEIKEKERVIAEYSLEFGELNKPIETQDGTQLYEQAMIKEELHRSRDEIRLYNEELIRIGSEYDIAIDRKVLNMVQPETVKVGDRIAGLVVAFSSSDDYGVEYDIKFDGDLSVELVIKYNPMFDQFFGTTNELDSIPYVKDIDSESTTFLINDPNNILKNVKDGDTIIAKFKEYEIRRMNGKPLPDAATIIAIE